MSDVALYNDKVFEDIKQVDENGVEYSVFNLKGEIVYQIEPKQEDELKPSTDIITNDDENKMKYSDSKKPLICM